jgi:hypothetical protein
LLEVEVEVVEGMDLPLADMVVDHLEMLEQLLVVLK